MYVYAEEFSVMSYALTAPDEERTAVVGSREQAIEAARAMLSRWPDASVRISHHTYIRDDANVDLDMQEGPGREPLLGEM